MSAAGTTAQWVTEFRAICGVEHTIDDPALLQWYRTFGVMPSVVAMPGSADEVAAILRLASQHGLSVVPGGGLTQRQTGNIPSQVDVLLLTSRLTGVEHFDPGDLTVGVGAGCTVEQLSQMVAKEGLLFAVDPPSPERSTIGGILATAGQGPLRHGYGRVSDFCIGVRFVTGDGRKAKGGGRVVKNVAGYDLMKLLIGSYGTLGVITSASFKLFPAPRQTRTFLAEFATAGDAVKFRDRILHSPLLPMCLELVSPAARDVMRPDAPHSDAWVVCLRASGSDAVLARYRAELGGDLSRELEGGGEQELWRALTSLSVDAHAAKPNLLLTSLFIPLRDVRSAIDGLTSIAATNGLDVAVIGRVGVGHLQAAFWPLNEKETTPANFANAVSAIRGALPKDGSLIIQHCPEEAHHYISKGGLTPTHIESMRAVKNALDPKNILNGGRLLF